MKAKMKIKVLGVMVAVLLMVTSCSGVSVEKGMNLLDDGKIDEAIEVFEAITKEDETNFEAWFGIVEALIEDEEYEDADEVLEEIYEILEDYYEDENEDIDYEDILDDLEDYADDILDEGEELGDWYAEAIPVKVNISYLDGGSAYVGETIFLDVPEGAKLYYNFTGDKVSKENEVYDEDEGILFEETGEVELVVAVINSIDVKGKESEVMINVVEGSETIGGGDSGNGTQSETDTILSANYAAGVYESTIYIELLGFDPYDYDLTVYYTLDGSDPRDTYYSNYYSSYDGIELNRGEYTLKAVVYDCNNYEFSDIFTANYVIESTPTAMSDIYIVAYDVSDSVYSELLWMVQDIRYYDEIPIYIDRVYDYSEFQEVFYSEMPPDLIYSNSINTIELYEYIIDASNYVDMESYDYFDNVLESVYYYDAYYCMPVTIKPSNILYYNYYENPVNYENNMTWNDFIVDIENTDCTYGFAYPQNSKLGLLGYYAGFGGDYLIDYTGYSNFEYDPLVKALTFIKDLSNTYDINYTGTDITAYNDARYYEDAAFVLDSPGNYYSEELAYDYEPVGLMPLPDGGVVKSPLEVYGLFATSAITVDEENDIHKIYEYLGGDYYYQSYIAGQDNSATAIKSGFDNNYYYLFTDSSIYRNVIENSSVMPLDLIDNLTNYTESINIESIMTDMLNGSISPEEAATQIINGVDSIYN
jgi:hypothetical protein